MRKIFFIFTLIMSIISRLMAGNIYMFPANKDIIGNRRGYSRWSVRALGITGSIAEIGTNAVEWDYSGAGFMSRYTDSIIGNLSYTLDTVVYKVDAEGKSDWSQYLKEVNILNLGVAVSYSFFSKIGLYSGYYVWENSGLDTIESIRSGKEKELDIGLKEKGFMAGLRIQLGILGIGGGITKLENASVAGGGLDIFIPASGIIISAECQTITGEKNVDENNVLIFSIGLIKEW